MENITCSYTKLNITINFLLHILLGCYHDMGIMNLEKRIVFLLFCANSSKAIIQTLQVNDPTFSLPYYLNRLSA